MGISIRHSPASKVCGAGLPEFLEKAVAQARIAGFDHTQNSQPAQPLTRAPPPLLRQAPPDSTAAAAPQALEEPSKAPAKTPTAEMGSAKATRKRELFPATQTEYVRIETSSKRLKKDLLTDHQREVAARQRQGKLALSLCRPPSRAC